MIRIIYDRECSSGELFPAGWGVGYGFALSPNPETRLHLPKRQSLTGWFTTLHEYAHYGQFLVAGVTQHRYIRHTLFVEAQASALALRWIAPEYQARTVRYYVSCLNDYIAGGARLPSSYWCTTHYLNRHIRRLER